MVWHELFPTHKHGCRKGGTNLKFSAKKAVFLVVSGKKQISPLLAPLEKLLEKSTSAPLDKSFRSPCTPHMNYTIFCKNCAVLHHLATLLNNTNVVSTKQAIVG